MDFLLRKEIEKYKSDVALNNSAIEADKCSFEHKLKNGLGDEIKNILNNPPKPSLFTFLKVKYNKWKMLKNEKLRYKKMRG